tara:strand:- start:2230 stop:2682 length:453 start_codon:yes stop_codon:yes gene_type:complete
MTKSELRDKIKSLIPAVYDAQQKVEDIAIEYDELTKFPELKKVIVNLLTTEFDNFLSSLDWIAPRPTTFRVNLKNGQFFLLIFGKRSWIAQVAGKKYYLLNLPEEERAAEAIARLLRYGKMKKDGEEDENVDDFQSEESDVEDTTDVEAS